MWLKSKNYGTTIKVLQKDFDAINKLKRVVSKIAGDTCIDTSHSNLTIDIGFQKGRAVIMVQIKKVPASVVIDILTTGKRRERLNQPVPQFIQHIRQKINEVTGVQPYTRVDFRHPRDGNIYTISM